MTVCPSSSAMCWGPCPSRTSPAESDAASTSAGRGVATSARPTCCAPQACGCGRDDGARHRQGHGRGLARLRRGRRTGAGGRVGRSRSPRARLPDLAGAQGRQGRGDRLRRVRPARALATGIGGGVFVATVWASRYVSLARCSGWCAPPRRLVDHGERRRDGWQARRWPFWSCSGTGATCCGCGPAPSDTSATARRGREERGC